jgi:hypothetical protein
LIYMACWVMINMADGSLEQMKATGQVVREGSEINLIDFTQDFRKKNIDMQFNKSVQWVKDNECLYADKSRERNDYDEQHK